MDALLLARWQFGITTVYHFFFVPLTIGLSLLTAGLQTAWLRTGREHYLRAAKFWGCGPALPAACTAPCSQPISAASPLSRLS